MFIKVVYGGSQDNQTRSEVRVERFHFDKSQSLIDSKANIANPGLTAPGSVVRTTLKAGKGNDICF